MTTKIRRSLDERDQGFTLIELLVVIIIVGILAAIAIPVFLNQREKGVDAGMRSDVRNLSNALEAYTVDNPLSDTFEPAGTTLAQNIAESGFKKSPGNTVQLVGSPRDGYCVRASNAGSSGGATTYVWYDSKNGGLMAGAPTATRPASFATCNGTFVTVP
ncbi:type II secretion system protein [Nocardioides litoris]|uniref:type II secretion system protein n=1 Tax=Nocardioides litoris TaxID=1926648 RepID=UPI00111D1757|nr:prepilin-type N-terminal cleavage/methylation domain-containing protein [Nocardioides litoris]